MGRKRVRRLLAPFLVFLLVVVGLSADPSAATGDSVTPMAVSAQFPSVLVAGTTINFTATFTVAADASGPTELPSDVQLWVTHDAGATGTVALSITSVSPNIGSCTGVPYTVSCPWANAAAGDTATISGTISAWYDASGPGHVQMLWSNEASSGPVNIANAMYSVEPVLATTVSPPSMTVARGESVSFVASFKAGADVSGSSLPTGVVITVVPEAGAAGIATATSVLGSAGLRDCGVASATAHCRWSNAAPNAVESLTEGAAFSADAVGTWDVEWSWSDSMAGQSMTPGNFVFVAARIVVTGAEPAAAPITTLLGDVNGDGKADVVDVYPNATYVRLSTGSGFSAAQVWSNVPFYGSKATLAAEMNADSTVDLIAINDSNVWVMTSTGTAFSAPQLWLNVPFYGSRATLAADGVVSRVEAVNDSSTWRIGIEVHSRASILDSDVPFYGNRATLLSDFTGDGYLDLIAVNSDSTWLMASSNGGQTTFGPQPQQTSATPFFGTRATLTGDVDGDGKWDLIAVNDAATWLVTAGPTTYGTPHIASIGAFYGTRATLAGDVNGDGLTDLVAVNGYSIWVMASNRTGFTSPTRWS